ncbi:MAG: hypothetical protein R3277_09485 [Brumimicrobium sp.]|nr:hypothetical protein [Brumimicrobium sp.]
MQIYLTGSKVSGSTSYPKLMSAELEYMLTNKLFMPAEAVWMPTENLFTPMELLLLPARNVWMHISNVLSQA